MPYAVVLWTLGTGGLDSRRPPEGGSAAVRLMRPTRERCLAAAAAAALGALAVAAPASADIFATFEKQLGSPLSLAKVNVTTGVFVALPAAVQTPGNELHPALSPDAKRLVFLASQNGAV